MAALNTSLTSHLFSHGQTSETYVRATQSAFLSLAGQGRLSREMVSQWLSQDRLYAQAYVRFIGGLLSRLRLSSTAARGTLEWRVLNVLKDALEGIVRELAFFEEVAARYGLSLTATLNGSDSAAFGPNEVTNAYVDLFDSFGGQGGAGGTNQKTLLDGLVLLWATEKVYLDAWMYASQQGSTMDNQPDSDLDGGALRKEFIPNWTSDEFKAFVCDIRDCLDDYAAARSRTENVRNIEQAALHLWQQVLELEEKFWPQVNLRDVASTA